MKNKIKNQNSKIEETHSIAQKNYLSWKNNALSEFFDLTLYHIKGSTIGKARGKEFIRKPQVRLRSKVSEKLIYYHNLFYKNNNKRIYKAYLKEYRKRPEVIKRRREYNRGAREKRKRGGQS